MKFYYLTMNEPVARERKDRTIEEIKKVNYPCEEFVGTRKYVAQTGCSFAHFQMAVKEKDSEVYGVLEDDVKILDEKKFNEQVARALEDKEWDIFYFSFHPPRKEFEIVGENENHYQIEGMLGTHAIMFRPKAIKMIIANTDPSGDIMEQVNIDVAIRNNFNLKYFCPKEIVVSTYAGKSIRAKGRVRGFVDDEIISKFNSKIDIWTNKK